jgi:diguanylate cyclase (GGDEF)-like protein/putative nucleotidyltransferase with HDIG domain
MRVKPFGALSDTVDMSGALRIFHATGGVAAPHLFSLEALALAIEAQGSHTTDHLVRARLYAVELARRLGLNQAALETLEVAGVLHDVGELAVPQSILSKAGSLTPEEFERMKTHAALGALIVERAGLPRTAARIVRSHHERWDGTGYPDGLGGAAIPLGARILAVADCLAGAARDRPDAAAAATLRAGQGTAFDPRVVEVALESYEAMERAVRLALPVPQGRDFRAAIAGARREERLLYQLTGELGSSLSLPDTLSAFDSRLKDLVGYACMALYQVRENRLLPAYVNGEGAQMFCSLEIPFGEGPSGVAALTRQPVLNGNPWADAAHGQASSDSAALGSTLAIPLEWGGEAIAVLSLYHTAPEAFGSEDLRILLALAGKLAVAVEHALHEERAGQLAAVDALTGLPNRRALFQRLDAELARCRRSHGTLGLVVFELDGLPRNGGRNGAAAARRLWKDIASRLRQICREDDCVARMGEGFVLVLGSFSARDLPEKRRLIESILAELAPAAAGARPLVPRIGAAYYPDDGAYAEDLLATADLRLNGARQA